MLVSQRVRSKTGIKDSARLREAPNLRGQAAQELGNSTAEMLQVLLSQKGWS